MMREHVTYQHMTNLPEDLERALLAVPSAELLAAVGWAGASDKYTPVQELARAKTEAELRAFVATAGTVPPSEEEEVVVEDHEPAGSAPAAGVTPDPAGREPPLDPEVKPSKRSVKAMNTELTAASNAELVAHYNKLTGKAVKRFASRAAALAAIAKATAPTSGVAASAAAVAKAVKKEAKTRTRRESGKFAGHPLDTRLVKISDESDFHSGSIRDVIFKKLLKAATVADAKKASPDPWHLKNALATKKLKIVKA